MLPSRHESRAFERAYYSLLDCNPLTSLELNSTYLVIRFESYIYALKDNDLRVTECALKKGNAAFISGEGRREREREKRILFRSVSLRRFEKHSQQINVNKLSRDSNYLPRIYDMSF